MSPEAIAYYEDGDEITGHVDVAVTGKQFVKINADRQPGGPAGVSDDISGGNVRIAPAGAGDKVFGVASIDTAAGRKCTVKRASTVMPVTAGAAITAGEEVQSDANGHAIPLAAGKAAGLAIADAANGADAQVALYL